MEKNLSGSSSGYPSYNLIQSSDDEYVIEVAIAGFDESDIDITHEKNFLRIEGFSKHEDTNVNYIHKGIGSRSFKREFALADYVEVKDAVLISGILKVYLVRKVPDELQPKKIKVNRVESVSNLIDSKD